MRSSFCALVAADIALLFAFIFAAVRVIASIPKHPCPLIFLRGGIEAVVTSSIFLLFKNCQYA